MRLLGLTGSIGMGKSTAAGMLRRLGLPVFDADAAVHALLAPGGAAVLPVRTAFPDVPITPQGGIDRRGLGRRVFADQAALARLEAILHPMVGAARRRFLAALRRRHAPIAVLDIPLLFETGGDAACDAVLVVSAPAFLQRARVLARPGMDETRLRQILAQQMPDRQKRRRTPYVVETGLGKAHSLKLLRRYLRMIGQGTARGHRHARGRFRY